MYKFWHDYLNKKYERNIKKTKTMLRGHRKIYSLHKQKIYLLNHWKRC